MRTWFSVLSLAWALCMCSCSNGLDNNAPDTAYNDRGQAVQRSPVFPSPPIPVLNPVPTPEQNEWQRDELYLFIHFGINTFTGDEWGDGTDSPRLFNPSNLDVDQWVRTAKYAGFKGLILTAKHHEGFSLWPTAYSDYSVASSPWKGGEGDLVKEVAEACKREGIKFGIYLSPWDRHEPSYGTPAYHDFFVGQLTELLTGYGPIFEVWLDGARDPSVRFAYDRVRYYETIRSLQPGALIANMGPDIRWVGNEQGVVQDPLYSYINESWWYPAECDVSIRPSWFWKAREDNRVKSLQQLVDLYFGCVGGNSALLLGTAPNADGRLPALDVERLINMGARLRRIFETNDLIGQTARASSQRGDSTEWAPANVIDGSAATFWVAEEGVQQAFIEITTSPSYPFNVIELVEPIQYGQRIDWHLIEYWNDGQWEKLAGGATIGYKRLYRTQDISTDKIRVTVHAQRAAPALEQIGVYYDPLSRGRVDTDAGAIKNTSN